MFDVFYLGKKPGLFVHERAADSIQHAQLQSRTRYCWITSYLADYTDWDFLWEPVPWQRDFVHVWPSQWHDFSGTYLVPKHTEEILYHFHDRTIGNRSRPDEFELLVPDAEFDFTWAPHPLDPPFVYVFGNQWWPANKWPTVRYRVPGATLEKYETQAQAQLPVTNDHWTMLHECEFDRSWKPDPGDPPYIYVFGNQWHRAEKMPTVEYHVPGATERKFMRYPGATLLPDRSYWTVPDNIDANEIDFSWIPDPGSPPYIYQFGTQWQKTGGPVYRQPGATEIKFVSDPRATKTTKDPFWEIPADAVYDDEFDWTWHPDATEQPYIYQFGTQWQKTGGPVYRQPGAVEVKYVDQIKVTVRASRAAVYIIDHMDGRASALHQQLQDRVSVEKTSRYVDNYLDTLRRIAAKVPYETEYIWIVSSICDYRDFDFTWYPEQWQATMLHVFASDYQKFGDTFFMHVPTFILRSETCQLLEWYDVNFVDDITVPRWPMPVIRHDQDSHVDAIREQDWKGPLALFTVADVVEQSVPAVPLWREKTKTVVPLDTRAVSVIVPRAAVPYIKTQVYDYPYIDRSQRTFWRCDPLDIVFISNGEHGADHHWHVLNECVIGHANRVHRVDGVHGRVAAYQTAAKASETAWFFAVFAKLQVNTDFDWSWQPDSMQEAKHYIFHAYNPVNDLVYGHQAVIAYNRRLVLANQGLGLDFTLDDAHEVVPIVSGTAYYDNDPWTCWRTAFRECIKLRHSLPDVENDYRLQQWLSIGEGVNGHWSTAGASDAVRYYESVGGDFNEIKKSYEWAWLASYAMLRHPELAIQSRT